MAIFYFDLHNSVEAEDFEGLECADLIAARNRAISEARAIAAEDVRSGRLDLKHRIVVKDEDRSIIFVVYFRDAVAISF